MEDQDSSISHSETEPQGAPAQKSEGSLPIVLTLIALIVWFGFQAFQMLRERDQLSQVKSGQNSAIQESEKIRSQFQGIVGKTAALASQGHAGARMVVDELQKRGLTFAPESKAPEKTETKPVVK